MINLNKSVQITLDPQAVQTVMMALYEMPYKISEPLIRSIYQQIQQQVDDRPDLKLVKEKDG